MKISVLSLASVALVYSLSAVAVAPPPKQTLSDNPVFTGEGNKNPSAIRIGILDTGIDYNHPKLKPFIAGNATTGVMDGWDYRDNDALPYDFEPPVEMPTRPECLWLKDGHGLDIDCLTKTFVYGSQYLFHVITMDSPGHGTHVAGIAQRTSKSALVISYRIPFRSPESLQRVIDAIELAAQQGVRIINMSFRYLEVYDTPRFQEVMEMKKVMAKHSEILFVVAAGNENTDMKNESELGFPAAFGLPNQITVGAVDNAGKLASFSNIGEGFVDVYAPGVNIVSTWPEGTIYTASGTSMASPFVAGLAARILTLEPTLNPVLLKERVLSLSHTRNLTFVKEKTKATRSFTGKVLGAGFVKKKKAATKE